MQHLESLSCDPSSVKADDKAKLKGYLRKWKNAKMFTYSCLFIDLLQPPGTLSTAFQEIDIDAVAASSAMATIKRQLAVLMEKESDKMATMKQ